MYIPHLTKLRISLPSLMIGARAALAARWWGFRFALLGWGFLFPLLLLSCSSDSFDFSSMRAYFVFDNSVHQDATLQSALNPMSPGVFCRVSEGSEGGSTYFYFESNQGLSSKQKANADDMRRTRALGIYNKTGIIVGYGNLSSPAVLYVYDSQCPNCYAETNMVDYKLALTSRGMAVCAKCKREYDLNNNGLTSNGKKLIKYRATATGPLGILSVNN